MKNCVNWRTEYTNQAVALFIDVDGICFNNWLAGMLVGLPSTKTRTFSLPRKLMLPVWLSTLTDCTLFNNSEAVVPADVKSFPTLITFLSTFCVTVDVSALTSTSSRVVLSSVRAIVPKLILLFLLFSFSCCQI